MIWLPFIFACSFLLTYLVLKLANKKNIIDIPNERSSHTIPTPRGGGLAIAITWLTTIALLALFQRVALPLFLALSSVILVSIISFLDDIFTIRSLPRFLIQCLSAGLSLYFIGGIQPIDFGLFQLESPIILNTVAFIGVVWFINLFNFIDGIDGYSSIGAISIALGIYIFTNNLLLLFFISAVLGFLPWNWQKAKIFMGDVGSTLLGFTLPVLLIYFHNQSEFSIINGLTLTSVYWFDTTYTLFKRFLNKEKLGQAHRKHAYQRIVSYGFSHQKTVLLVALINLGLIGIVFSINRFNITPLIGLLFALVCLFVVYKRIDAKVPFK